MKGRTVGGIVIACVVLAIWSCTALDGDDDPAALTTIAGCYSAPGQPQIRVAGSGTLSFGGQSVRVHGYRDKQGLSLLPQYRVTIDRHDDERLEINQISPVLLPYDQRSKKLEIPDYHLGDPVYFQRTGCA